MSSGGCRSTSAPTVPARRTPRPRAARPSRSPSPTRRRPHPRHRRCSHPARRTTRSRTRRRSSRSPTSSIAVGGPGIATWVAIGAGGDPAVAVRAVRRRRRGMEGAAPSAPAVPRPDGWARRRSLGRGHRPVHGVRAAEGRRARRPTRRSASTSDGAAVAGLEPELHHLADEVDRAAFAASPPDARARRTGVAVQRPGRRRAPPPPERRPADADAARPAPAAPRRGQGGLALVTTGRLVAP